MTQENKNDEKDVKDVPDTKETKDDKPAHVGVTLDVSLNGFNGDQPIRAKIDTGAQASCLHGSDIDVTTDDISHSSTVRFKFGEYQYNMPVVAFQAITSADGGTVNRPVVQIPARINGEYIEDAVFNLNDRSSMDFPILIGLDLIKSAKLTIDPNISEMEVTFGPAGMEKVDGSDDQGATVDKSIDSVDNDNTSNEDPSFEQKVLAWVMENRSRTVEEVFMSLISSNNDTTGTMNDATE